MMAGVEAAAESSSLAINMGSSLVSARRAVLRKNGMQSSYPTPRVAK